MLDIKFVRMSSGEDLVSEVSGSKDGYCTLSNPLKMLYMFGKIPGSLGISLVPWVFNNVCDKQEFNISVRDITIMANTSDKMSQYYLDALKTFDSFQISDNFCPDTEDPSEVDDELDMINGALNKIKSNNKRTIH